METIFKVAKYKKEENGFVKVGYDEYKITYLKGTKVHQLRIVVNGYLTKRTIDLMNYHTGYKSNILSAISDFNKNDLRDKSNIVKKKLTFHQIEEIYSEKIQSNVRRHLLTINKENNRDTLTQYSLI